MKSLTDVAQGAAHRAAEIIRDGARVGLDVRHKGAIDLVTQIYLAAEAAIREHLQTHTPDIPILAEEGGGPWDVATRWIVDPLDGTTNFVHAQQSFLQPAFANAASCCAEQPESQLGDGFHIRFNWVWLEHHRA